MDNVRNDGVVSDDMNKQNTSIVAENENKRDVVVKMLVISHTYVQKLREEVKNARKKVFVMLNKIIDVVSSMKDKPLLNESN
ncbi:uncharacterized protein G2W53_036885 [Senna tora]|uniref:Uncharacterized protein n=1 Tax=Senna tora TaxID=362788 RepID=A0A834W5I9_9FABA|nr:uncharacterized protein G2W53_036885 [Senna tora]